jgi:hypothetical protein
MKFALILNGRAKHSQFKRENTRMRPTYQAILVSAALALFASAPAEATVFGAQMQGIHEVPPNASPATGFSILTLTGDTLNVDIVWDGLIGGIPSAAHIHCCVAPGTNVGVAVGFPGFPATTSGSFVHDFDLTDSTIYTANFLNNFGGGTAAGAEAALIAGLFAGEAYTNIHNAVFPGGEIRGLVGIPEPATIALFGIGLGLLGLKRRKRSA